MIYPGLTDWLRWRRRDKAIRSVGASRQVDSGNPRTDRAAGAHPEIQFVARP